MLIGILRNKLKAGDGLIEFGTRYPCLYRLTTRDGTFTKKPLSQRYRQFPDGTPVQRDLIAPSSRGSSWTGRVDARQAAIARRGAERLRTDITCEREGLSLPHVSLGVAAGCLKTAAKSSREAGNVVAAMAVRVSGESSAERCGVH
jgi:hypothetical protein